MKEFHQEMRELSIEKQEQDLYATMVSIGAYCKHFRVEVLQVSRSKISNEVSPQTLAHFENGNSTNMLHYIRYFKACKTIDQKLHFLKGINEIMVNVYG